MPEIKLLCRKLTLLSRDGIENRRMQVITVRTDREISNLYQIESLIRTGFCVDSLELHPFTEEAAGIMATDLTPVVKRIAPDSWLLTQ